ncbi:MAG TPA: hypothetical protein VH257_04460 [Chloroflexota bacterium]|jgi:hypothetical protein|nr:hypothetical protein [Chloroflexota bacterium]
MDASEGLREEDLPDDVLDEKPAELLKVFVRELIVNDDSDRGSDPGEFDLRFGLSGDDDLVGNRVAVQWQGTVRTGETIEVLGWLGPVTVSLPDGVLTVGVAGEEDDFLADDIILGGVARFGEAENWGIGHWWRTRNGEHCDFVFAVVREEEGQVAERGGPGGQPAPVLLDEPELAPGPEAPGPDDYRAVFG